MIYKFPHPEWFDGVEKPQISSEDTIILWGAGKLGGVVAHAIKSSGLRIAAFVDSANDKQGTIYLDCPVISPHQLYTQYSNAIVIVSCAFPIVYDELQKDSAVTVYDPHSFLLEIDFSGYVGGLTFEFASRIVENALRNYALYYGTGSFIERLAFLLTDKCTLNCKNCDGYIPFHAHPKTDSLDTIKNSYKKIIEVCGHVEIINLLGGEPLLHPDIAQVTRYFANDNRCSHVAIISNGTIVPKPELIDILKSPKCTFRISDYGNLSRHKDEIIALLEKEKIKYEVTNYQYWDRIPTIQQRYETSEQLNAKYAACTANLFYVKHGKLFQCTFVAGLSDLGRSMLPDFEKNYVDLFPQSNKDVTLQVEKFVQQLHLRQHLDACKYCPGSHCLHFENKVPVAEQAKGRLPLDLLYKDGVRPCD